MSLEIIVYSLLLAEFCVETNKRKESKKTKKRMIALFLTFAMIVPFTPAVAADDTVPRPTVEEILSEYHQKAFEAEAAGETATASTYSRSGSSERTLEQETVDTLNAAGYEAYNVTSENYDTLQTQLQTDFADMGLDPEGSYIITISGEDSQNSNASGIGPRMMVPVDPGGGGDGTFTHTYNGTEYRMRYMTVAGQDDDLRDQTLIYTLRNSRVSIDWDDVDTAILYYASDHATNPVPVASILSMLTDAFSDDNYIRLSNNSITMYARTIWDLQYIQVYNSSNDKWISSQRSEYANSSSWCIGSFVNEDGEIVPLTGKPYPFKTYSPDYANTTLRKDYAARAYLQGFLIPDFTDDINFYLMDEELETNYCGVGEILFTQWHWTI